MAFNQDIPQFTTQTSNHCDNFNEVNNLLLQNTMENKKNIQNLDINSIKNFALPCFENGTGDMNTFLQLGTFDTGSIFTNRISNGPVSYDSQSCILITNTKGSDNTIFQEFYIYGDDGEGQKFYRCVYGSTYDTWQEYARKSDIKRVEDKVTVLSEQERTLEFERGYLSSKQTVNANELIKNGKYTSVRVNTPTDEMWNIEVIEHNTKFLTQVATLFANKEGFKKNADMHIRNMGQGEWTPWKQIATTDKIDISLFNGWVEQYDSWNSTSLQIIGGEVRGSIWIKNASITQAWATILSIQGATFLTKSRPVLLFSTTTQSQYIGQFNNSALACPSNIPVGDYIITF